jgi:hypothetical protein
MSLSASYIIQCRTNWFMGIRPCDKIAKEKKEYQALIEIAQTYFDNNQYKEFAGYLMEGQYLIPLWTAHLILEYGQPPADLKERCLEIITDYTDNPLAPEVATEERKWLDNYMKL